MSWFDEILRLAEVEAEEDRRDGLGRFGQQEGQPS